MSATQVSSTQVNSPVGNAWSIVVLVVRQAPCRASCPNLHSSCRSWEENRGRPFFGCSKSAANPKYSADDHGNQHQFGGFLKIPKCFCFPNVSLFEVPILSTSTVFVPPIVIQQTLSSHHLIYFNSRLQTSSQSHMCSLQVFVVPFMAWHPQQIARLMGVERCVISGSGEEWMDGYVFSGRAFCNLIFRLRNGWV